MKRPSPRYKAGDKVTSGYIRETIGEYAVIELHPVWNGFTFMYGFENGNGLGIGEMYLSSYVEPVTPPAVEQAKKKEGFSIIKIENRLIPNGGKLVEAYETEKEIVVCGDPEDEPEEHDDSWYETSHNCDAMGCGGFSHVIYRFDKDVNDSHAALVRENKALREALQSVVKVAEEAFEAWDTDQDMRVGKILSALARPLPSYRADIDAIHATLTLLAGNAQGGSEKPHPQCSVCEGEEHHWRPNSISPEDTDERSRFVERHGFEPSEELLLAHESCAHCNAVRPYGDGEEDEDDE
jgi:hypothetical protein